MLRECERAPGSDMLAQFRPDTVQLKWLTEQGAMEQGAMEQGRRNAAQVLDDLDRAALVRDN